MDSAFFSFLCTSFLRSLYNFQSRRICSLSFAELFISFIHKFSYFPIYPWKRINLYFLLSFTSSVHLQFHCTCIVITSSYRLPHRRYYAHARVLKTRILWSSQYWCFSSLSLLLSLEEVSDEIILGLPNLICDQQFQYQKLQQFWFDISCLW